MAQLGFEVDLRKCVGCHACAIACKQQNNTLWDVDWRRVIIEENGSYPHVAVRFVTMACFHCSAPACLAACPVPGAIFKRPADDPKAPGVVVIDESKCIGCRRCIWACPYGAPQYNAVTGKVEKCHLCLHRLEGGTTEWEKTPACVLACPGRALKYGEINSLSGSLDIEGLASSSLTGPNVKWKT